MASGGEQTGTEIPIDISRLPVGEALRVRREQLGWGLAEVAAWLRIRLPYLEALEGGQVGKLPGNAYATGFLRAYAAALGLDADDMVRRFRGETKDVTRKPELSFPVPVPERGVPAGAIVLLGVVMVVAAYVGWYELGGRATHEAHTVPPVPDALTPYAGSAGRGPSPQVATVMPGPGQTPSPLPPAAAVGSVEVAKDRPAGSTPETAGVAADMPASAPVAAGPATTVVPPVAPTIAPAPVAGVATTAGGAAAPPAVIPAIPAAALPSTSTVAGQVTLNAVSNCWVQVRQVGGKVIYDHVLQAGEHWSVPADAGDVVLSTGNAGGLTVSADGVTSSVLGRVGGVRRSVPLSAEAVKSGSIAGGGDTVGRTQAVPAIAGASPGTSTATTAPASAPPSVAAPASAGKVNAGAASGSAVGSPGPVSRPHAAVRHAAPGAVEDETERLNRAQLKQPASPQ